MPQDYDSASREPERQNGGSLRTFMDKIRQVIQPKNNDVERQPLLGARSGDNDDSTVSSEKRNVIVGVIVISAIVIIGVIAGAFLLLDGSEQGPPPQPKLPSLTYPEKIIVETPCGESVRDFLKIYTSEPHMAGTDSDKRQALWTQDKFISYGIKDTIIETYYPLLNYPLKQQLAIVDGPEELRYEAKLKEDPVDEDKTSDNPKATPLFHGYSKNGTALGPVVYANYGRLEDFEFLESQSIQLKGTIALMRYGGAHRGLKLRAAEKYGCIGALVYSDPIDDGPLDKTEYPHVSPDKAYPEGPWRSPSSAQRGSVQYVSLLTGDPTTPGWAATADAKRIPRDEHPGMTQIPSLPLSYEDALPLLKATQGRGVRGSNDWAGGLTDVDYYSGPTEGNAYLVNIVDDRITPIWNVIGRIKGTEEPDRAIILGNHRDAWVYGAVDPSSGSAAMLELARTLGVLLEKGWRPRRTIVLASWDAEEYGMVGSTEWVEDHYEWLAKEAVAYINVDVGVSGPHFEAKASPSLNRLLYNATRSIIDPRTGLTVYDAWSDYTNRTGTPSEKPTVGQLGSGSDFVVFLTYAGVASMDFGFHGDYGVYHSNYDSFHWMEKFGDPTFEYHATLVKIWGLITLHLADDIVLPIYPGDYAAQIQTYIAELENSSSSTFNISDESLGTLRKASHKLVKTTRRFERRREHLVQRLIEFAPNEELPSVLTKRIETTNKCLTSFERGFIDLNGITGREWFKHVIYAPGLWTGYASRVFPAIVEAFDANDPELLKYALERAAHSLYNASELLKAD